MGLVALGAQVWQDLLTQCVGGEGCHPSGMYTFSSTQVARPSWYLLERGVRRGQVQALHVRIDLEVKGEGIREGTGTLVDPQNWRTN